MFAAAPVKARRRSEDSEAEETALGPVDSELIVDSVQVVRTGPEGGPELHAESLDTSGVAAVLEGSYARPLDLLAQAPGAAASDAGAAVVTGSVLGSGGLWAALAVLGAAAASQSSSKNAGDSTAPKVSAVAIASASGAQNKTLNAGDVVTVTVSFSEAVTVTGTPQLALNIGGVTVQANYLSGSGSNSLSFSYTIAAGQADVNGIGIDANALSLNGGAIRDAAGNNATLTQALVVDDANYLVDTTAPVSTLASGTDVNSGSATAQSSETSTAYLVKTGGPGAVTVTNLASITGAPDAKWNSAPLTAANANTSLSLAGLEDGTYSLFTVDAGGNLSAASTNTFEVISGSVIDGYISGATVFMDVNGNGRLDADEPSAVTDARGNYSLSSTVSGTLIAFGGTDVSTGLEFKGALKAPAGASVITPLTTLVSDLVAAGSSLSDAKSAVFSAMGQGALASSVDLLRFDPIKATQGADSASRSAGLELQKGAVLVANMVADAVTKIQQATGAGNDSRDEIARDVFVALAGQLRTSADNKLTTGVANLADGLMIDLSARISIGGLSGSGLKAELLADKAAFVSTHSGFREAIKDVASVSSVADLQRQSQSAPRLLNAGVDGLGDVITLYFDRALDGGKPPAVSQFVVRNGGSDASLGTVAVSSLQVVNHQVLLRLAAPVNAGQAVQVAFTDDPRTNDIQTVQDKDGVDARSFSGVTVRNALSLDPSLSRAFAQASTLSLAGAEISAFDPGSDRLFVTSLSGLQVIAVGADLKMSMLGTVSLGSNDINSVAVKNGRVAVAVAASDKTQPGEVYFLDAGASLTVTGQAIASQGFVQGKVTVGALPDMVTFSADGKTVLVANEAEQAAAADATAQAAIANPEGSVSIIDLSAGVGAAAVRTATFSAFNSQLAALKAKGVRLMAGESGFQNVTVAQDLEPEYIAIAPDGKTAFVTLQENNAIAVLDIATGNFTDIVPLGLKSFLGLPMDGSDRDGPPSGSNSYSASVNLQADRPVFGQYMPDAIAPFRSADGRTYYVIANEGDDRNDFIKPTETSSVSALNLDTTAFPNAAALKGNGQIGRLTVSNAPGNKGDVDGDGDIDQILSYGARSFSILNDQGVIVFDSGSHIEQFFSAGGVFSAVNPSTSGLFDDTRSDNKGPEPEGVTIGQVGGRTLAFVGLERGGGGVMVYDVTEPAQVSFVQYLRNPADVSPEGLSFVAAKDSPSGLDALFVTNEVSNTVTAFQNTPYTLQLLHFADAESGMLASQTAPRLAALVDRFEDAYANSITLAGGDNFIPGPFLAAGTDEGVRAAFNSVTGSTVTGTMPIAAVDIALHNLMGVQASAVGNHEFDLGSNVLVAAFGGGSGFAGAQFPYISANLDVSGDSALKARYIDTVAGAGLEEASNLKGRLVPSAVITEGGQKIGLVGATTQLLESISSPSGTKVRDNDSVRSDDMTLLASQLQPVIDELISQGVNKIVLMSHLQVLANERLLATKLSGVDIILGAGSNTRLGDPNDQAVEFAGHAADFADTYPVVIQDKSGGNTLLVNTDNEFTYLGRLVVDFNADGQILTNSLSVNTAINGAYAATDANVARAWGVSPDVLASTAYGAGTRGAQVKTLTDAVQSVINAKDGEVYGYSEVYLEGERIAVRNQETNLGNLSADANTYALDQALGGFAPQAYLVSLRNGGGIRAQIGTISAPKADGSVDKLPPEGGVSQLDVENSLRFDNKLMAFDTTPAGLKAILEHGVGSLGSQGRFPQLGGVAFSYDPDFAAGSRVGDIALIGDGYRVNLYNDGNLLSNAPAKITVVTLNFLANGGDSYPIKAQGENFRYLVEKTNGSLALTDAVDEALDFTKTDTINAAIGSNTVLGEQVAFAAYMQAFHGTAQTAYAQADTPAELDNRIQNLNVRSENVLAPEPTLTFAAPGEAVELANYFLVGRYALPAEPSAVNKLAHEASAITYNKDSDTLFVVGDGGTSVTQVSKQGVLIDSMALAAGASPQGTYFYDTEGLAYLGNGRFVLVEERDRELNEFVYTAGATLGPASGVKTVKLGTSIGNVGLEGLSLDPLTGGFLLAKEASPMGIFQTTVDFIAGTASNGSATAENSTNLFDPTKTALSSVNDIYALSNALDPQAAEAGNFLLLSAAEGRLLEMDRMGKVLGSLSLNVAAKNEGLTMDGSRRLYIVGEEGGGSLDKPELLVYAPTAGKQAVGLGSHLYLNFNSAVSAGAGSLILSNGAGDSRSIDIADTSQVSIAGATLKVDLATDLLAGQTYTLTYAAGVLKSATNAAMAAVAGDTLSFQTVGDVLPPQLLATSPIDNAAGVTSHHIILTFSEAVKAGSGNIVLRGKNAGGLSDVRTIAASDFTQVTFSGASADINPSADLFNGYTYSVEMASGAVTDLAGNAFPGLVSPSALSFTRNSGAAASPQTVIVTEINSNAGPADFFELYNYGTAPVVLDGWKWDDDSASFSDVGAASFPSGTTIEPGARLVVVASTSADAFRSAWGLTSDVTTVVTGGPGLGQGDAVVLFNAAGKAVTALNYGTAAKTASDGSTIAVAAASAGIQPAAAGSHAGAAFGGTATASAVWDGASVASPTYGPAAVGQLGAFAQAATPANIGSPGLIAAAQAADTSAPTLSSSLPAAGSASALATTQIVLNFSESVKAGSGNLVLLNAADASDTRTIAVGDASQISIAAAVVTLNPSADLRAGATYALQMASGVIEDLAGNDFAGLQGEGVIGFSVVVQTPKLVITELNSNAGPADFFELFNAGAAPVSLKGWRWDDDSASFSEAAVFPDVSIPVGGTLVVASTAATGLPTFKSTWGLPDGAAVIASEGPGLGGGDAVVIFNDAGALVSSFNYSGTTKLASDGSTVGLSPASTGVIFSAGHAGLAFGASAATVSAVWDGLSLSAPTYRAAQVGIDGGVAQAANVNNIGSPGSVPALEAGDVRFLAANADAVDAVAFMLMQAVPAGTRLGLTDRNYSEATGMPATGESAYFWTADRAYDAGTIVTVQPDVASGANPIADKGSTQGAGGGLSGTAETVYAFLGSIADLGNGAAGAISIDRLLASINVGGAAAGDIPASIATASQSFNADNAKYAGSTSASDIPALVALVSNAGNWSLNDTTAFALSNNSLFGV